MVDMMVARVAIHLLVLLALAPLLPGVINRVKSAFGGRKGPSLFQLYFDLWKLWRKRMVFSITTTWIFRVGPVVSLCCILAAGLFIPMGPFAPPLSFTGDMVLVVYLLATARFFTTLAALDTGSPFEGMGAAREVTFGCLSELPVFFALLAMAGMTHSLTLSEMLRPTSFMHTAPLLLLGAGLFVVLLAETCRVPVDDPNTHLELTMIHEVMVLDHSGPLLGAALYGASVKMLVLGNLVINVLSPLNTGNPVADWAMVIGRLLGLAAAIGVIESVMARLPMRHVPRLLVASGLLCMLGYLLSLGA